MSQLKYLNVGCGEKIHPHWMNIDMVSRHPSVKKCNLLKGIPFSDHEFEVVYHSQVLEHFSKQDAPEFLKECYRVLQPGGVLRVVVPDLESIASEYLEQLRVNLEHPSPESAANYDWMMLELFDQTVRNVRGGEMAEYLKQPELINEEFVMNRIGEAGRSIREIVMQQQARPDTKDRWGIQFREFARRTLRNVRKCFSSEAKRIGKYRLGGEIHQWMYDRYSLSRSLSQTGFVDTKVLSSSESGIPLWDSYELDEKDGQPIDLASLYMEATKPPSK